MLQTCHFFYKQTLTNVSTYRNPLLFAVLTIREKFFVSYFAVPDVFPQLFAVFAYKLHQFYSIFHEICVSSPFLLWKSDFIAKKLSLTRTFHSTEHLINQRCFFGKNINYFFFRRTETLSSYAHLNTIYNSIHICLLYYTYTLKYCLNVDSSFIQHHFLCVILKSGNVTLQFS